MAFLAGLVYDEEGRRQAAQLLGQGRTALLHIAGARGLEDRRLAAQASQLVDIALDGCRRLGPDIVAPADVETADAFFERYTRRGRSPAHDDASTEKPYRLAGASR
jgi:hypothetical protein